MTKANLASEHQEQKAFFEHVGYLFYHRSDFIPELLFSTLNGAWFGGEAYRMAAKLKEAGFKNGVADVLYLQPRGQYSSLAIEMKRADKKNVKLGGLRDDQVAFLEAFNRSGGLGVVCYGADEAIEVFSGYMALQARSPI